MDKKLNTTDIYKVKNKNIGVLGGTFDPPHFAHIHMAQVAMTALEMSHVIFIPLGVPPHKTRVVSDAHHRIKMLEIMLVDYPDFYIDTYEALRENKSYTVNSIARINDLLDPQSKMYFIIGADSLMYLDKWYDAKRLMASTHFAVIPRMGFHKEDCIAKIKSLQKTFSASITYIETHALDYASTKIRNHTDNINDMTDKRVMDYIKENNLYNEI